MLVSTVQSGFVLCIIIVWFRQIAFHQNPIEVESIHGLEKQHFKQVTRCRASICFSKCDAVCHWDVPHALRLALYEMTSAHCQRISSFQHVWITQVPWPMAVCKSATQQKRLEFTSDLGSKVFKRGSLFASCSACFALDLAWHTPLRNQTYNQIEHS